jgi:anti-sigma factor RsiW
MTARIFALDSDEHREAQSLLPWLANGTLPPAELERVRRHVAQCDRCRADAAWQDALRDAAASLPTAGSDVERDWAAMRAKLAPREARAWTRLGWPMLAGAQAVAMLVLAAVLVTRGVTQDAEYRTLGNTPAAPTANALVVFQPGASETQIRQALRTVRARIVDGPTATDAYLLHMPSPTASELARLRSDAAVMRVESLQGGKP